MFVYGGVFPGVLTRELVKSEAIIWQTKLKTVSQSHYCNLVGKQVPEFDNQYTLTICIKARGMKC